MNLQRGVYWIAIAFSLVRWVSEPAAAQQSTLTIPANEMSSIEWRDCAGHYFYLSRNILKEIGEIKSAQDKQLIESLNTWATMAIYASEEKARVEARDGKQSPLGRSLRDPKAGGQLKFDVDANVASHEARVQAEGRSSYVTRYKDKCYQPVTAFTARFKKIIDPAKKP